MSMMRLLSAGRSLVDTKTLTPNYRMRGKFHLPKFGGPQNPFVQPVNNKLEQKALVTQPKVAAAALLVPLEATVLPDMPPVAVETSPRTEISSADKLSAVPLKKTQRMPVPPDQLKETKKIPFVATRKSAQQSEAEPGIWRAAWGVVAAGFKKLNAFAWEIDHKPRQKAAIPRFDKPAQGELSLDNIRVVRNDLCDSDLEITPAKTFSGQTNFRPALQPVSENKKADEAKTETPALFSHTCAT
jgi:hypothetical protein